MIIVVMGVSGSGKTTIGTRLADALRCPYLEGDSLHSQANIEKMSRGIPLTDADRAPWLAAIHARMLDAFERGQSLVVGCSALKRSYRATLAEGLEVTWVYLKGDEDLIRSRLEQRTNHFLKVEMLTSQVRTLEEPVNAFVVDISQPPETIVAQVVARLRVKADVRVSADASALGFAAAEAVVGTVEEAVRLRGRCSLVLSGGSTPRTLYQLLASRFRERVSWASVHLFWADERYVAHDDPRSNYRMARETMLALVPCPPDNVHPMRTDLPDPDTAARDYESTLRRYFDGGPPSFDLVLLGLGADGHTASLFPGTPALAERTRWVVAATVPAQPPSRLTLTLPVLTGAARTYFLVAGADKADAVSRVLTGAADPDAFPAAAIQQAHGRVTWWLDREAAAQQG